MKRLQAAPRGSCHWISVLHWRSDEHEVAFYAPAADLAAFTAKGSAWMALLFRTDSWAALTRPTPMAGIAPSDQLAAVGE